MLGKLIPAVLALLGLAVGAGAGMLLRPPAPDHEATAAPGESAAADPGNLPEEGQVREDGAPLHDYVKLNNQFVVPVVEDGRVAALVILSLSLEVTAGMTEKVYMIEPKLRDAFLQVMFDHANSGGFRGTFTDGANMVLLRGALREVAIRTMGSDVTDVLIVDIVRQDS